VQRPCRASDGSPRLRVGATFRIALYSRALIYDPATGDLVGLEFMDDVNYSCFGDIPKDCATRWPDDYRVDCAGLDAGAPATFGDAGSFACEVADAGWITDAGG
jgi:hypothetical protein